MPSSSCFAAGGGARGLLLDGECRRARTLAPALPLLKGAASNCLSLVRGMSDDRRIAGASVIG